MVDLLGQWAKYPAFHDRVLSMIGIEVHWAILQYVVGLSFIAFVAYLVYLKTGDKKWEKLAYTIFKGFVIVFAVGAATGTASEFGLVLLWPNLTEAAGRYIYFPLYAEVFAFLLEVIFVYLTFYGWKKFGKKAMVVLLLLSFIGPWYSAAMIVSVNSYMVAPTGIVPAYDPSTGAWLYDQGYPKITLVVPNDLVEALNVSLLQSLGMTVKGKLSDAVIVEMPSRIVQHLAYEAWSGHTVKDSILALVANKDYVKAHPEILNVPVKAIVDKILVRTVEYAGVEVVTFKSPVYTASILHVIGSALTVSAFTMLGAYALRIKRYGEASPEYKDYIDSAFKFAAVFALVIIALQGFVFGHEMGVSIAHYNPEKFSAMEATTSKITPLTKLMPGAEKLAAFLAYGDPNAPLPSYDEIPDNYCACQATLGDDMARIGTCKPPLIIHYLYYTKIGLGVLLGLYALILVFYLWRSGVSGVPGWLLALGPVALVVAQIVSYFGWAVREIGRKPWTIYGVMTPDVAHTANPASTAAVALVALFFIVVLAALGYSVYRFLWVPGRPEEEEVMA
ncbi:MAG: cytochrome ubiquinol oxidase subunit I [Desulfurococcales archaeon]|nr:cytochrome ubiquinol oxidase subunit I [Desulfurococcales archaeon]